MMTTNIQNLGDVDYSARKHYLSDSSKEKLESINPRLAECVHKVSGICSDLNIQVIEGKRTEAEHNWLWQKGVTQNSGHSAHLYGYAVDLGIFIGNRLCLEAEVYDELVRGMIFAAQEVDIKLRWGGAPQIDDMRNTAGSFMEDLTNQYIDAQRERDRRPYVEVHHFEIGTE